MQYVPCVLGQVVGGRVQDKQRLMGVPKALVSVVQCSTRVRCILSSTDHVCMDQVADRALWLLGQDKQILVTAGWQWQELRNVLDKGSRLEVKKAWLAYVRFCDSRKAYVGGCQGVQHYRVRCLSGPQPAARENHELTSTGPATSCGREDLEAVAASLRAKRGDLDHGERGQVGDGAQAV